MEDLKLANHVARMEEDRSALKILIGRYTYNKTDLYEGLDVDERKTLEWN